MSGAIASAGTTSQAPRPQLITGSHARDIPAGAHVLVYGKDAQGKRFSYTYLQGQRQPRLQPDALAVCTVSISDISLIGGQIKWETQQVCSGAFGEQKQETQIWRSSYRGYVGYGPIGTTPLSTQQFLSYNWSEKCNSAQRSTYNYLGEVQGFATNIGWSGWVRSGNNPKWLCGSSV
jgi:hypothetical protein